MKILIATDGSEYSHAAVDSVTRFFGSNGPLEIKVISVHDDQAAIAMEPFAVPGEYCQQLAETAEKNARAFVAAAAESLKTLPGANTSTAVVCGHPAQGIIETAKNWQADMIVVGSHGRGFWGRMLGSVSDAVVHHAPCSVLVVRGGEK